MLIESFRAEAAVEKYEAVMFGTDADHVKPATGAGVLCAGVCMHAAAAGEKVDLVTFGPYKCIADDAIAKGALVRISATTGKVDDITAGVSTLTHVVGTSLEAVSADGDLISVFIGKNSHAATT
jgi:hypothetical protein